MEIKPELRRLMENQNVGLALGGVIKLTGSFRFLSGLSDFLNREQYLDQINTVIPFN